ncbi:efflux RND transporter periplasmic adaptor subunit [Rickettsiales bacterium]|nr:efflux RND transporter periplasmic adaptor subunit [Rickettsiales bacterium]
MNKNRKKILTAIIALIVVFFIALSIIPKLLYKGHLGGKTGSYGGGFFDPNRVIDVDIIKIAQEKIIISKEFPARVNAYKISQIRPEISGIIEKITFIEGSKVKKGQQLYQINDSVQKAEIKQALLNYEAAKSQATRFKKLLQVEGISKQEYEDILSKEALAKAKLANAKDQIDQTKVLAPISGNINKTNFTVGALVTANQETELTTITSLSPIYVDITQPTSQIIKNSNNLKVSLIIDNKPYSEIGTIQFQQSFIDQSTDSITLRAKFNNKNQQLIPGMFVNAFIHIKEYMAITVPQSAVMRQQDGSLMVFIINKDNIATPRIIQADQLYNNKWIVKKGLKEGEIIINKGLFKIRPNAKVKYDLNNK